MKRRKLSPTNTFKEISEIFKNHNVNLSRFNILELKNRKAVLTVDWFDTKEVNGVTVAGESGCMVYSIASVKQAAKIREAVLEEEPKIGDKIRIKLDSDRLTYGLRPSISLKGVEAIVYNYDNAIPTTAGLSLMIRRAENILGFHQEALTYMKYQLKLKENLRTIRLPARGYMCNVVSKPKVTIDYIAALITGELPTTHASKARVSRVKLILKKNIPKLT